MMTRAAAIVLAVATAVVAGLVFGSLANARSVTETDAVGPTLQSAAASGPDPAPESAAGPTADTNTDTDANSAPGVEAAPGPDRASVVLAGLTVEEKVGQLFMPLVWGHDATEVTPEQRRENEAVFGYGTPAEIVSAYKLGGVIYLGQNIIDADQVETFSAGLQDASRAETGIELLVAVDQEGGRVNRLTDGVTVFPSAAAMSGDEARVREAGYLTGRQVLLQGINVVLAPVADISAAEAEGIIGSRSYGQDPAVVADMVSASVGGLQEAGVAAAVKHWPGHGSTELDSHELLPVLDVDRMAWDANERIPFQAALDEDVSIVLVGHLALPNFDPEGGPASTSPVLIHELLRTELGYEGVVMTDALNMGAVEAYDEGRLSVDSIVAGVDILLIPEDMRGSHQAVLAAVESGEITPERLDESVLRVLRLKESLGLLPPAAS